MRSIFRPSRWLLVFALSLTACDGASRVTGSSTVASIEVTPADASADALGTTTSFGVVLRDGSGNPVDVAAHQIERVQSDDFYNFQDGAQIRRIEVNPDLRARLVSGQLAIVRCEGRYAFVPAAIGEEIGTRVEKALLHLNRPQAAPAEDDPYKDHVVPDDLMW